MERTIIIHRTAEEEPPRGRRFLVGYNRGGEDFAFPCRFSRCQEGWNVGDRYWSWSDLAKLYPYWMDIPDFPSSPSE